MQVPVYREPSFSIPGTPGIVKHEILNNRRHVLTKVIKSRLSINFPHLVMSPCCSISMRLSIVTLNLIV